MVFKETTNLTVYNRPLRSAKPDESFKYLGAFFTASGLEKINTSAFQQNLRTIIKTPAKPQQKLFMLKNFLIPAFQHVFTFSRLYANSLNKLDIIIRKGIRHILHLPHDLPRAAFHGRVADGGLGIPSLRFTVPLLARKRFHFRVVNPDLL